MVASVVKVLEAEMVQTCAEGESGDTQDSICICRLDIDVDIDVATIAVSAF